MLAELKSCSFDELKEVPEVVERLMQEATESGEEIIYTKAQGPFSVARYWSDWQETTETFYEFVTGEYDGSYITLYRVKVVDESGKVEGRPVMIGFGTDELQGIVDAAKASARMVRPAGNCREILGSSICEEHKEA